MVEDGSEVERLRNQSQRRSALVVKQRERRDAKYEQEPWPQRSARFPPPPELLLAASFDPELQLTHWVLPSLRTLPSRSSGRVVDQGDLTRDFERLRLRLGGVRRLSRLQAS